MLTRYCRMPFYYYTLCSARTAVALWRKFAAKRASARVMEAARTKHVARLALVCWAVQTRRHKQVRAEAFRQWRDVQSRHWTAMSKLFEFKSEVSSAFLSPSPSPPPR